MTKKISKSMEIDGKKLTLETGQLAGQAEMSVLARLGDTMVLAAVVLGPAREDVDFLPLSVEYVERLYAGGKIKGSRWVKREGRPSDGAVLTGRIIDRSIRPLFPKGFTNDIQLMITVLSVDLENDPDILSMIAASAALTASRIPWNGPIGATRVGRKEDKFLINPLITAESELDLVVSSVKDRVVMLEAGAKEISEDLMIDAILFGKENNDKVIEFIEEFAKEVGKKKDEFIVVGNDPEIEKKVQTLIKVGFDELFAAGGSEKEGMDALKGFKEKILANFELEEKKMAVKALDYHFKKAFREKILNGQRPDKRAVDEIREISAEVGLLPRTHGSAVFTRGQTQVLNVTTLGAPSLELLIESAEGEKSKRFIHHYSMPPYSVGEVGRVAGPNRREIGHGALAERAVEPVLPTREQFPYTIFCVSEVLSSNGSTSMASACSTILSLMDAGVPITAPVAGIAMGLITTDDPEKFLVLTDIAGFEDFNGDMDFKVAGTRKGITAIQLDMKVTGITEKVIREAIAGAQKARFFILDKMAAVLPEPRAKLSQYAPRVVTIKIETEKIGEIIGPGGKLIRKIIAETGANVDVSDDGSVNITGTSDESVQKAVDWISGIVKEVIAGEEYMGEVKRIQPFGAFVEILPGKEGLVHVSQMSEGFVDDPTKIVTLGQKVPVTVMEIDDQGRLNLSMLSKEQIEKKKAERPPREERPRQDAPRPFRPRRPRW